jgi:hypothetical protein
MLRLQTYFQGRPQIHRLPVLQGTSSFFWILALYRRGYQAGHCEKGKRCKFSHDLNVNRKAEKIDMYSDARKDKETGESSRARRNLWRRFADTMDKWDQAKLAEVVVSKSGNAQTSTE